jgi:hypothetical protein
MTKPQPYGEPLRVTLTRTVGIAALVAAIVALSMHDVRRWPALTLVFLWPSFGGHWIDLWYLNWLRPRLPSNRSMRRAAHVATWFAGGVLLGIGVRVTASSLLSHPSLAWLTWWRAGAAFVAIELAAHVALHLRGMPSFYRTDV